MMLFFMTGIQQGEGVNQQTQVFRHQSIKTEFMVTEDQVSISQQIVKNGGVSDILSIEIMTIDELIQYRDQLSRVITRQHDLQLSMSLANRGVH